MLLFIWDLPRQMISIYAVPTLLPFVRIFFFKFSLILWIYDIMIKMNTKNKIDFKIRYLDITKKEWQMRKDTKNFIKSADYDLKTAEFMLNSGRYIYVIFMCHLSLEKILKAIVTEATQKISPKTHNLIYLLKLGNIQLPSESFDFIAKINNANIVTRYPEDFSKILEAYPESVAEEYFCKTKEILECLKKHEMLKE